MNDVRPWVAKKLEEEGYTTATVGAHGLSIRRDDRSKARVWCAGLGNHETFGADDVDAAIEAMSDLQFVVVVPMRIQHPAFERAEKLGVCVDGFNELKSALADDNDVSAHLDTQAKYETRRLLKHKSTEALQRRGHRAYTIQRYGLAPLTIVTTNRYEFTADELYELLEDYDGIDLDLVVVTNPNCQGVSTDSVKAGQQTGVRVVLFNALLEDLGQGWT